MKARATLDTSVLKLQTTLYSTVDLPTVICCHYEKFKHLGVLFTNEGRTEQDISRRIGKARAVLQSLQKGDSFGASGI